MICADCFGNLFAEREDGTPICLECGTVAYSEEQKAEYRRMEAEYRAGTLRPEPEPEEHWTERLADERRGEADDARKAQKEGA